MSSSEILKGRYYRDGASEYLEAELHHIGEALYVVLAGSSQKIHVQLEEVADRLGNVPRKIYLMGDSVFECTDNTAVDAFFKSDDHFFSRLTRMEGSLKFVAVVTVATFICLFGLYRYGLPAVANVAAKATPAGVVEAMDSSTRETVDKVLFSETKLSQARQDELTVIFDELVEISGQSNPPMKLHFRDGGAVRC